MKPGDWIDACPDCGSAAINSTDYYGDVACMDCPWIGVFDELDELCIHDTTNSAPTPAAPGCQPVSSNAPPPIQLPVNFWTEVRPRLRRSWAANGQKTKLPHSDALSQRMNSNG